MISQCRNQIGSDKLIFEGHTITDRELYQAFAIEIYLRAGRYSFEKKMKKDVIPEVYKDRVRCKYPDAMGVNRFKKIKANFYIPCKVAKKRVSNNMCRLVEVGEWLAMDEKLKK